jgi:broad specificity phosphatase PhoE
MSQLILLRHGQAAFGAERYDQLSELGLRQAQAAGRHWAAQGTRFTRVIIGPRRRHRLTAQAAIDPLGLKLGDAVEPALDEFADGSTILASARARAGAAEAPDQRTLLQQYGKEIEAWAAGEVEIPGTPTARAFRTGIADWLGTLTTESEPDQNVLAVTSGGVIAAAFTELMGLPDREIGTLMRRIRNASLTEVLFSRGRMSLLSFNCAAHLPADLITLI